MGGKETGGFELAPVDSRELAPPCNSPACPNGPPREDAAFLQRQTRTRRLFNEKQLFAFSLVYMGTWNAVPS